MNKMNNFVISFIILAMSDKNKKYVYGVYCQILRNEDKFFLISLYESAEKALNAKSREIAYEYKFRRHDPERTPVIFKIGLNGWVNTNFKDKDLIWFPKPNQVLPLLSSNYPPEISNIISKYLPNIPRPIQCEKCNYFGFPKNKGIPFCGFTGEAHDREFDLAFNI